MLKYCIWREHFAERSDSDKSEAMTRSVVLSPVRLPDESTATEGGWLLGMSFVEKRTGRNDAAKKKKEAAAAAAEEEEEEEE